MHALIWFLVVVVACYMAVLFCAIIFDNCQDDSTVDWNDIKHDVGNGLISFRDENITLGAENKALKALLRKCTTVLSFSGATQEKLLEDIEDAIKGGQ